jgi:hypothetical protein
MGHEDINKRFGWFWLTFAVIFGFVLELMLAREDPKWIVDPRREQWRSAHAHAALLAVVNLIYAHYLADAKLSKSLKRYGSYLIVAGAILIPIGVLAFAVGFPPLLNPLGAIATIAGVGILAYGYR